MCTLGDRKSAWETLTHLTLHRVRVQLAHVAAAVLLLHRLDVQIPRELVRVGNTDSGIVGDDVLVNRLDRLRVGLHPADLEGRSLRICRGSG